MQGKKLDGEAHVEPAKDTKLGILIAALRRKKGSTIDEMRAAIEPAVGNDCVHRYPTAEVCVRE